jgi:hypothetical protein
MVREHPLPVPVLYYTAYALACTPSSAGTVPVHSRQTGFIKASSASAFIVYCNFPAFIQVNLPVTTLRNTDIISSINFFN